MAVRIDRGQRGDFVACFTGCSARKSERRPCSWGGELGPRSRALFGTCDIISMRKCSGPVAAGLTVLSRSTRPVDSSGTGARVPSGRGHAGSIDEFGEWSDRHCRSGEDVDVIARKGRRGEQGAVGE